MSIELPSAIRACCVSLFHSQKLGRTSLHTTDRSCAFLFCQVWLFLGYCNRMTTAKILPNLWSDAWRGLPVIQWRLYQHKLKSGLDGALFFCLCDALVFTYNGFPICLQIDGAFCMSRVTPGTKSGGCGDDYIFCVCDCVCAGFCSQLKHWSCQDQ